MDFILFIVANPATSQAAQTAARFAQEALRAGHRVRQAFFYADGAYLAQGVAGGCAVSADWQSLADRHAIALRVCDSGARRRATAADGVQATGVRSGLGPLLAELPVHGEARVVTFA